MRFEYLKKNQKERGSALVGLELRDRDDLAPLLRRVERVGIRYHGRMPPTKTAGPFAAMLDDPDGNVLLLTSDAGASPSNSCPDP